MSLTVGTNSWVTLEEAEEYMSSRLGAYKFWYTGVFKEAALITAYNFLNSGKFEFPADISVNMKNAQCEMALFLLQHLEDMDARIGLQAQGVTSAGVVQEGYDLNAVNDIPMPPTVYRYISVYKTETGFEKLDVERDDDDDTV
ncbi:hypothetical protein FJZ33_00130 [Candidatus Poribacteria bacterium]|nr:hypothetical protein [Candidatus Poribacteria bacterium]